MTKPCEQFMVATIDTRLVELEELCRKHRVRRLEVFGSAADGTFDPSHSDLDFLVEYEKLTPNDHYEAYLDFGRTFRNFSIVGEAMMQLKAIEPSLASAFTEYERIIGFRHVLIHGYFDLDADVAWVVLTEKLPTRQREPEAAVRSWLKP